MTNRVAIAVLLATTAVVTGTIAAWEQGGAGAAVSVGVIVAALVLAAIRVAAARGRVRERNEESEAGRALAHRLDEVIAQSAIRDQILGSMSEAVMLVEGGTIAYANTAAERLLGARIGRPPPPQVTVRAQGPSLVDIHHPARRTMRSDATDLGGGRIVIVAQDVTESERIDQIRRDFVANASHEMKTPVAAILATAETLPDAIEHDPETARRFAATLADEAGRLSRLIQDLLDLARLDQPRAANTPTEWSALVRAAVEDARTVANEKRLTIHTAIDDGVVVQGRAQDLAQVARNLLDNALNYTPHDGRIEVRLSADADRATLVVLDTGIGIPTKELARVFERFYRVDRARSRATGGTGLGLSIVRHVVEAHGGSVRADSELGRGSRFTVSLPLPKNTA